MAKHIPDDADADQPDFFTDYEAQEKQKAEEQPDPARGRWHGWIAAKAAGNEKNCLSGFPER